MDDVLGDDISRRGLSAKKQRNGTLGLVSGFDLLVFPDDIQGIHLLAFILVKTLDLNVEH